MTPLLIPVFCLGLLIGMIYTYAVYQISERKHKHDDDNDN